MINRCGSKKGLVLLEAVAAVVVVSVCLTLIAQTLLTNFYAGARFQEDARALMAMENKLGMAYAKPAAAETKAKPMDAPYDQLVFSANDQEIKQALHRLNLMLQWPSGRGQRSFSMVTIVYDRTQAKTKSYTQ